MIGGVQDGDGAMKPKKIIRPNTAMDALGCRKSKFHSDYIYHPGDDDEFIPGSDSIKRLKLIYLGPHSSGVLESDLDALIDALVAAPPKPRHTPPKKDAAAPAKPRKVARERTRKRKKRVLLAAETVEAR
jgi:hypothetical protein